MQNMQNFIEMSCYFRTVFAIERYIQGVFDVRLCPLPISPPCGSPRDCLTKIRPFIEPVVAPQQPVSFFCKCVYDLPMEELPPLKDIFERFDLNAKKALGQNFLLDINLTRKIARAAGPLAGVCVLEIGPGPGGLTRGLLLEGAAHVVALEKDARCLEPLKELSAHFDHRLSVYEADALDFDISALPVKPTRIVANLPYNVGTKLLTDWLELEPWPSFFDRLVLMFQKEVAQRIVAKPGTEHYGRLSVLCGWRADARLLFDVHRSAFTPPPKITSSIVEIVPKILKGEQPRVQTMARITQSAFGQRRKMLRQSLKGVFEQPEVVLTELGIAPTARAEELSVNDFVCLALHFEKC